MGRFIFRRPRRGRDQLGRRWALSGRAGAWLDRAGRTCGGPCCRASEASAKRQFLWPSFLSCVSEVGAGGSRGVRGREAQAEGPRRPAASEQRRGRPASLQEPFRVEQEPFGRESLAWKPGEHHRAEKGPGTARVAVPGPPRARPRRASPLVAVPASLPPPLPLGLTQGGRGPTPSGLHLRPALTGPFRSQGKSPGADLGDPKALCTTPFRWSRRRPSPSSA